MAEEGAQFVYSGTSKHDADVRNVAKHPIENAYISSSYDKTAKIWCDGECLSTFIGHDGWVLCAAYVPEVNGKPMLMTTGWDKNVVLWDLDSCQPEWILDGHAEKATCIAVLKCNEVVTGGYDNTIIIWKDAYEVKRIAKHTAPVSCVGALPSGEFLSGGAHGCHKIYRWTNRGELKGTYAGHTSGVRGVTAVSTETFASCSNDTTVRLWDLASCATLKVFVGHTNQVYSVTVLPGGDLASSSEDKTIRVWDQEAGECKQSLPMACAIFSVVALDNGDIVAGGTDGNLVRFSRDPARQGTLEDIKKFEEMVASQKVNKGGLGGLDLTTLPGPDALNAPGTAEGQQKIIRRGEGAEVYCWNMAKAAWEKIGDVVDGEDEAGGGGEGGGNPLAPKKPVHNGKEYDYVFDVDLTGDGRGYLKLPYNRTDNPYEAAQQFIFDNMEKGVHQGFLDEIAKFIITNADMADVSAAAAVSDYAKEAAASGKKTMSYGEAMDKMQKEGQSGAFSEYAKEAAASGKQSGSVADNMKALEEASKQGQTVAFSSFAREAQGMYAAADTALPAGVEGPMVTFEKINAAGMVKKLTQLAEEQPPVPGDGLAPLLAAVEQLAAQDAALSPATFPTAACTWVLEKWAHGARFPVIDFLRLSLIYEPLAGVVLGAPALTAPLTLFAQGAGPAHANEEAGCLKAMANAFATRGGRQHMSLHTAVLLPVVGKIWKAGSLPARAALSSVLLNYARLYRSSVDECNELSASDTVPLLCEGVLFNKEADVVNAVLFALGALILPGSVVAESCLERAKKCFLQDSLPAIIPSSEAAATVRLLTDALRRSSS
eukprot:TRINITY_DN25388_c0_g1_i1.p1 TRINITY_DN25388_c0_g1~~TRINITY_DN25388_c0_g1_i1.p1  ORF type:complete len:846 (+),score=339.72 TRINITY_DN25388_c0_g1_i1:57-2540(+)